MSVPYRVLLALIVLFEIVLFGNATIPGGCKNPLFAFGFNEFGQLGDGTNITKHLPVAVERSQDLSSLNVSAVAAGLWHSLVLTEEGVVFSFGSNGAGRLGDGTFHGSNSPVRVSTSGVLNGKTSVAIAAGAEHSLVLSSTGHVFSFGQNSAGQLGDGTNIYSNVPVAVNESVFFGSQIQAIAAGGYHSLVLTDSGQVFSFGLNNLGQLGDGTNSNSNVPVAVTTSGVLSGIDFIAVVCGAYHSLVLGTNHKVYSFGGNDQGQLGDGTNTSSNVPVAVRGLDGLEITSIAAGTSHSLVLSRTNQKVYSFGGNDRGQLGDGTTFSSNDPVQVNIPGITAISAGGDHSLVLTEFGDVFAFGSNAFGELGDGNAPSQSQTPVAVNTFGVLNGIKIANFSAGFGHSLVLGMPLEPVYIGGVWNGEIFGMQIAFQSENSSISVNWQQFTANWKPIHSYNVTTAEWGNPTNVVLHPRIVAPSQEQLQSQTFLVFQSHTDAALEHNKSYVTTISFNSFCGDFLASSDPFLVDLTPPNIEFVEIPAYWQNDDDFTISCDISDPESGIIDFYDFNEYPRIDFINATSNESIWNGIAWSFVAPNQIRIPRDFRNVQWVYQPIKLRITAFNGAGLNTIRTSESSFRILYLSVAVPHEVNHLGNTVRKCSHMVVEWNSQGVDELMVELFLIEVNSENVIMNITDSPVPITQCYYDLEPLPNSLNSSQYRVKLKSIAPIESPLISISEEFEIIGADACINIISPKEGSTWQLGSSMRIEWEGFGNLNERLFLTLVHVEYVSVNISNIDFNPNGFFDWTIPFDFQVNTSFQMRIESSSGGVVARSAPFEIASDFWNQALLFLLIPIVEFREAILSGIVLLGFPMLLFCLLSCCICCLLICCRCCCCRRRRKSKSSEKLHDETATEELFDPDADIVPEEDEERGVGKPSSSTSAVGNAKSSILSTSLLTSGERLLAERVIEQFQSSKTCPLPDVSSSLRISEWLRVSAFLLDAPGSKECAMEMTSVLWESLGTDARRREAMQQHSQMLVLLQTCVHKADPSDWNFVERIQRSLECFDSKAKQTQFELLEELGSGAYGSVHVAKRADTGETVAVKVVKHMKRALDGNSLREVIDVKKIKREILIMSILAMDNNPHLIHFIGHQVEEMRVLMVMARAVGNVKDVLTENRLHRKQNAENAPMLSVDTKLNIAIQVAEALAYLHSFQIAHRDLKSENILLMSKPTAENSAISVRLIDFGISRATEDAHSTFIQGTVSWAAPEVLQAGERGTSAASPISSSSSEAGGGKKKKTIVTTAVDVYSFAYLLWALLSEREPHSNFGHSVELIKSQVRSNANCPLVIPSFDQLPASDTAKFDSKMFERFRDLILQCWQSEAAKRPKMPQVVDELKAIQAIMRAL